jgi:aminocarboxymuconate-semialdehyde decarboxylase
VTEFAQDDRTGVGIIDVHAHVGVPAADAVASESSAWAEQTALTRARYRDPVTAAYMKSVAPRWNSLLTDLDARRERMDAAGVAVQFMSVNPGQYYYWADKALAAELVQAVNEHLVAEAGRHPEQLVPIATVSLQHPELAASQLRHAVNVLGMAGVQFSTTAAGRYLSSPHYEPLWEAAAETDAMIFLHPLGCRELTDRLAPSYLNNIIGQPLETTIALSHLIFTGVLDRHPSLRFCAAHGGGYLPYYLGRFSHAWAVRPDTHSMDRAPVEYLKDIWFDSVVHSSTVFRSLIDVAGSSRVVIGTDYPFDMGDERPADLLEATAGLTPAERFAISAGNAIALLGSRSIALPHRFARMPEPAAPTGVQR